ncbi:hypothetical protein VNO78_15991 [Psophocarpus tetragonolobus]|uniref:Glycosyltransferase n=1 Tax=Psophocarpus tetragonolobus TaxID=3891 RepID=A0AAN9SEZ9_PSOTE
MEDSAKVSPQSSSLNLYFLPFPTPGHMNPLIDLAKVVAFYGHQVTILTTPSNVELIPKHLKVHTFNFPSDQIGLPQGLENLSSAQDNETAYKIWKAMTLIKPQIENFVHQNPPHALILDTMFTWGASKLTTNINGNVNIPTVVFNSMPIFVSCIAEALSSHPQVLASDSSVPFVVPGGLPHDLTLSVKPTPTRFGAFAHPLLHAKQNNSHGIIVNSFAELEHGYTHYYEKLTGAKLWHVGMTSLMVDYCENRSTAEKDSADNECLKWLSSKEPRSVVYICFGSLTRLQKEQYLEIARGIEASGHKFLWVFPKNKNNEVEEEMLPQGFEERMKENDIGMVVRGWVPQCLILKHVSIGGFITHCGWNSVTEGICAGVPMITMPRFGDQILNEKLVSEVHKVGVEVGVLEWSMSPYDARSKVVGWEQIENAVRRVMKDESGELNKRVKEMKEKAHKAVQKGGSSCENLIALLQSLQQKNDHVVDAN